MQAYRVLPGADIAGLERAELAPRALGAQQIRVRVHAVSLNYRDLSMLRGAYPTPPGQTLIPCSDAAGEVVECGAEVTRFRVGDRVASTFFPHWHDGEPTPRKIAAAPGAAADGYLAEEIVLHEDAAVATALEPIAACTLPCAGVTAWNALFEEGRLQPGSTVLLLGTGGVSIWALQLAKAAGLRAIVTSSSDAKLQRARELGADATIHYLRHPEWQEEVARLGYDVDLVVEVGGQGTLARSIGAVRMGGRVVVIGGVSGFGAAELRPRDLIGSMRRLSGIYVGSRAMHDKLERFVAQHAITPVVDRVFGFEQARDAFALMAAGGHFGKIVVALR